MREEKSHAEQSSDAGDRWDAATSRRLKRLGDKAIDTASLEQRLDAALAAESLAETARQGNRGSGLRTPADRDDPSTASSSSSSSFRWPRPWLASTAAVAAVLVLACGLLLWDGGGARPGPASAHAAAIELSRLHHDVVAGRVQLTPVNSMKQANVWIAQQRASGPALPNRMAGAQVQSCCLTEVRGELVAVARLRDTRREPGTDPVNDDPQAQRSGEPAVTLVVARAPRFARPMGERFIIGGKTYFGHEHGGVRMMMANRGDRWLCVMGDRSYQSLAALAAAVEF